MLQHDGPRSPKLKKGLFMLTGMVCNVCMPNIQFHFIFRQIDCIVAENYEVLEEKVVWTPSFTSVSNDCWDEGFCQTIIVRKDLNFKQTIECSGVSNKSQGDFPSLFYKIPVHRPAQKVSQAQGLKHPQGCCFFCWIRTFITPHYG